MEFCSGLVAALTGVIQHNSAGHVPGGTDGDFSKDWFD